MARIVCVIRSKLIHVYVKECNAATIECCSNTDFIVAVLVGLLGAVGWQLLLLCRGPQVPAYP